MNWNFVMWFAGVCATVVALRFIVVLFGSLFSKESMKSAIGCIGNKINEANATVTEKIKEKAAERKQRKAEENRATVIIR